MAKRTIGDIEKIWANVEGVKRLSDRAVGIGPFGLGLDALLTWIPGVGTVYTAGAAGWLMVQALRVNASPGTLAKMAGFLGLDLATTEIPVAGDLVDTLFPGHLLAGRALQKDIETTHWVEDSEKAAKATGQHEHHLERMKREGKRRLIYLHD
jgi:hypothetical protein